MNAPTFKDRLCNYIQDGGATQIGIIDNEGAYTDNDDEEEYELHTPDFASVALYIPAIQVVASTLLCCLTSLLACWLLPHNAVSSIRSASLCLVCTVLTIRRPVRVGNARGIETIFNTIRPAVVVYLTALVVEQLAHSCVTQGLSMVTFRAWLFQGCMVAMMISGFVRAWMPRADNEVPFIVSSVCLLLAALMPPSPDDVGGPLCTAATGIQAIERIIRSILFSSVYCTLVFAAHPHRYAAGEVMVCSMRAAAGSIWVLGVVPQLLPLVLVQLIVTLFSRMARNPLHTQTDVTYTASLSDISPRRSPIPSPMASPRHGQSSYPMYLNEGDSHRRVNIDGTDEFTALDVDLYSPRHSQEFDNYDIPYDEDGATANGTSFDGESYNIAHGIHASHRSPASSAASGVGSAHATGTLPKRGFVMGKLSAMPYQSGSGLTQTGCEDVAHFSNGSDTMQNGNVSAPWASGTAQPVVTLRPGNTASLRCISGQSTPQSSSSGRVAQLTATAAHSGGGGVKTCSAERLRAAAAELE